MKTFSKIFKRRSGNHDAPSTTSPDPKSTADIMMAILKEIGCQPQLIDKENEDDDDVIIVYYQGARFEIYTKDNGAMICRKAWFYIEQNPVEIMRLYQSINLASRNFGIKFHVFRSSDDKQFYLNSRCDFVVFPHTPGMKDTVEFYLQNIILTCNLLVDTYTDFKISATESKAERDADTEKK